MPIPSHLESHARVIEDGCRTVLKLCTPSGCDRFCLRFSGCLSGELLTNHPAPLLLAAADMESGEEFILFDAAQHGYNPVICSYFYSETDDLSKRKLQTYPDMPLTVTVILDYDNKADFSAEHNSQLYRDAFTWIRITAEDTNGRQFLLLDYETA